MSPEKVVRGFRDFIAWELGVVADVELRMRADKPCEVQVTMPWPDDEHEVREKLAFLVPAGYTLTMRWTQ